MSTEGFFSSNYSPERLTDGKEKENRLCSTKIPLKCIGKTSFIGCQSNIIT